jgi:hypothetical protein
MNDLLFDTPWWLLALIAIVGIVLSVSGNRRGNGKVMKAGMGVILLAIVLGLVSFLVETPKERALSQSRKLINSFEKQDWKAFESVLPPNVTVSLLNSPDTIYSNRDKLVAGARNAQEQYHFQSMHVLSISADQADTLITVDMELISTQDFTMGRPITSALRFEWQEAADGWALERIIALKIANVPVDQVKPMFPRGAK